MLLYIAPALPLLIVGEEWAYYASIGLAVLWLPAFFLAGVIVFNGYPHLIATNNGIASLRYALSAGREEPLLALARGLMLLFPIPGFIVHFLMVFCYPIVTAWAVAATADDSQQTEKGDGV